MSKGIGRRFRRACYLGGTATALLTHHACISAQEPDRGSLQADRGFQEIVVTARRADEKIQKVPIAITAYGGDDLDRIVVNNPQDLNKLGPSITTNGTGIARDILAPSIRGLSTSQASNVASVISYFAEVPNFQPSFYDLESLQVLKGPQGTLFGETAVGGALLFVPRRPSNELGGYASIQAGNYGHWQFEGAVGGALVKDRVMLRAAVQHRKRNGFTKGITSYGAGVVDLDDISTTQWRISLLLRPSDNLENYTIYAGNHRSTNGASAPLLYFDPRFMVRAVANAVPAASPTSAAYFEFLAGYAPPAGTTWAQLATSAVARQMQLGPRAITLNTNTSGASNFDGVINQTRWDISDNLAFRNIASYSRLNQIAGFGNAVTDGSDLPLLDNPVGPFIPGTRTARSIGQQALVGGIPRYLPEQFTEEAQLQGNFFNKTLQWQAGVYYRRSRDDGWGLPQAAYTVAFGAPAGDPLNSAACAALGVSAPCSSLSRRKETAYAVYVQGTYAITPEIHLTAGYRRSYDKSSSQTAATSTEFIRFNGVNIAIPIAGRAPLPTSLVQTTRIPRASHDNYSFTADWQVTPDTLLYVAHRLGYKPGGINFAIQNENDPFRTYKPETIRDLELGVKSQWRVGDLTGTTNLAMFQQWYSDIQQSSVIPGTVDSIISNDAKARIRGLEFEASVVPTSWFRLTGAFSYIDYKYVEWIENAVCARQFWRPQCVGLPGTTPVIIDHAHGALTVGSGAPIRFTPDLPPDVSKSKWVLQPSILLKDFTGEDITVAANIYSRSKFTNFAGNRAVQAGVPPLTQDTILGPQTNAYIRRGYTLVDMSAEWRNIGGSRFSTRASVTNLFNKTYAMSANNGFTIVGLDSAVMGEPRMAYVELRIDF